jgi:catalase
MNRSHVRYRQINPLDPGMFWDLHVNNWEGIPASLQRINAFSVHTYTLSQEVRISIGRIILS